MPTAVIAAGSTRCSLTPLARTTYQNENIAGPQYAGIRNVNHPLNFWNSQFGQSFAVLTHCRVLYTLHAGTIHSKKVGVEWARNSVDPKWIKLIAQAWYDREGVRFGVKIGQRADAKLLDETLEFMQHVMTGTAHLIAPP